jgi:hypothetical protein
MPKYLILVLPFYLILIARSLSGLSSMHLKCFLAGVICLTQIFSLYNYFNLKEYHNSNQIEPWREVATSITDQYQKGDIVLATNRYISFRILGYYLNALHDVNYPILCLEKNVHSLVDPKARYIVAFGVRGQSTRLIDLPGRRLWLVSEIHDDQIFPPGYLDKVRNTLAKRYYVSREERYVPYEMTLAARLPKKRHALTSARIEVDLYARK